MTNDQLLQTGSQKQGAEATPQLANWDDEPLIDLDQKKRRRRNRQKRRKNRLAFKSDTKGGEHVSINMSRTRSNHESKKHSSVSDSFDSSDSSDYSDSQMIQQRERREAEEREKELKAKFERERAELAEERAKMIKQLNKMREEVEEQKQILETKKAEMETAAQEQQAKQIRLERQQKKNAKKIQKQTEAQALLSSVQMMGKAGPRSDAMTQTRVDEECLWDTKGGHEMAVSGHVLEEIWEARKEAVAQLYGENVVTRKFDPLAGPDEEETAMNKFLDNDRAEANATAAKAKSNGPQPRGKGGWLIPPALRHFMANLPRTVEAQPVKSLAWLSKTIDQIYEGKLTADYYDTRDGDPLQSLTEFLCEYLLMKYGLRRVAEMHLYEVVMAVKKYFSKNPKVKMFARFLGLVKIRGKATSLDKNPDIPELDIGVLQIFLYTRRRLMVPPTILHRETETPAALPNIKTLDSGGGKGNADEEELSKEHIRLRKDMNARANHVTQTKDCRTYVPLGHAITQMRRVTGFMAPRKLVKFMRTIERGVAMRRGDQHDRVHPISNDTGGQTAVRFVMRNAMLDNAGGGAQGDSGSTEEDKGGSDGHAADIEESSDWHVVCCLDTSMEVLLEILEVRSKQVYDELVRAFVDGDDNGDGVLSFDEFEVIIQKKRPEFSARRALRMFKIALEKGTGNSTAIERPAFVLTCKQFGMGQLVDTAALDAADRKDFLASLKGGGSRMQSRGSLIQNGRATPL